MKKIFRFLFFPIFKPVYKFLMSGAFRHSVYFSAFSKALRPHPKEELMNVAFDFIKYQRIGGDYLEFGIYEGGTFASVYHHIKNYKLPTKCYGFDSFEGLPEIEEADSDGVFRKGDMSCSLENVRQNLIRKKVNLTEVTLLKGRFKESLNSKLKGQLPIKKAALIWIDCDLYESTVPVLEFIISYLQDGTIIIFDDWFCFRGSPEKGEQKAFREWKEKYSIKTSEFRKCNWHGNSFIVHR